VAADAWLSKPPQDAGDPRQATARTTPSPPPADVVDNDARLSILRMSQLVLI
jgi:hypothetical protein